MSFYFKTPETKSDPKDARTTPGNVQAEVKAAENVRLGKLKFESEAEHRDYIRMVKQNPNNKYGLPIYYPPLKTRMTLFTDNERYSEEMIASGIWKRCNQCQKSYNPIYEHDCEMAANVGVLS